MGTNIETLEKFLTISYLTNPSQCDDENYKTMFITFLSHVVEVLWTPEQTCVGIVLEGFFFM